MRRENVAATLVALACMPLASPAQPAAGTAPSVTVYGRVDLSVNHLRYGAAGALAKSNASYVSGDSSHLGFRGSEDLGGGSRAYFKMEHWFNADTGTQFNPVQFWSREIYVGLGNTSWGSLQLGSQYAPGTWVSLFTDPFLRSNQGAIFTLLQQTPGNTRGFVSTVNNAVQYISPAWSGVQFRLMGSAAEGVAAGNTAHASVEYRGADRLYAGVAYDRTKITGAAAGAPALPNVRNETISAGLTYRFDAVKLHAYYLHSDLETQPKLNGYMLGVTVPLGGGEVRASWTRRDARDAANPDASLAAAGYFHPLSKRTTLYAVASRLHNEGAARFNLWPASVDAGAAVTGPGRSVTGTQVGVRHVF